jgi:hypothetical protein
MLLPVAVVVIAAAAVAINAYWRRLRKAHDRDGRTPPA